MDSRFPHRDAPIPVCPERSEAKSKDALMTLSRLFRGSFPLWGWISAFAGMTRGGVSATTAALGPVSRCGPGSWGWWRKSCPRRPRQWVPCRRASAGMTGWGVRDARPRTAWETLNDRAVDGGHSLTVLSCPVRPERSEAKSKDALFLRDCSGFPMAGMGGRRTSSPGWECHNPHEFLNILQSFPLDDPMVLPPLYSGRCSW